MKKNYYQGQTDHCGIDVIVTNNTNTPTTANSPNEPYSPINAQLSSDCGSYGHAGNTVAQSTTTAREGNATETLTTSSVTTPQTATYIGPQNDDVPSEKEEEDLKRDWAFIRKEVWGFPVTKAALFIIAVFVTLRLLHVI